MKFEEWLATSGPEGTRREGSVGLAEQAWKAAMQEAAKFADETAKRYKCSKMRGVCRAIADRIKRGE